MALQAVRAPAPQVGVTYTDELIRVDGQVFIECRFERCSLEFAGEILPTFVGCTMIDVSWRFVGGAGNTIGFLQMVYHSFGEGGQEFVRTLFQFILDSALPPGTTKHGEFIPKHGEFIVSSSKDFQQPRSAMSPPRTVDTKQ